MLVTINTDASWHPTEKIGAFAFWAVSDIFKIQKAGYFRDPCKDPTEAEAKAILNAIHVITSSHQGITRIIFNTDSLNAKAIFENDRKHINRFGLHWGKSLRHKFRKIFKEYDGSFKFEFRHVKAHSGKDDKRSYVNEWCDTNAKFYMWKRFHELGLKSIINQN